jgi:septal ring-binding cell division protein DamX
MGVAATALIGTVLGMHERINDLLGGDAYSSVAVSAERPVLRLADKDNPWAVVIRDGESIQISCGPPAAQTVAVRPIPAAAPLDTQAVMKTPLIQPVSDLMDEGTGLPPAIIESPVAELPVVTTPQAEELPEPLPTVPPEKGDAPVSEEGSSVPLVVKPPLPSIAPALPEMANGGDEMAPEAAVEKLSLDSVLPDPVTGSEQPQIITILGSGLEEGSKVAVSWGGKVKALDSSQIVVRDPMHMELTLTTGLEPGIWAVQVSTPGQQRSNVLRFQVEAPKPDAVVEMAGTEVKPEKVAEKVDGEMPLAKPAETVPVKEETKPELPPEKPVKKTPVVKKAVPAKKAPQTKSEVIQGSQWVVVQPGGNYTLQLLASSERKALDAFVAEYAGLRAPLAGFEQQRSGKTLHVLIQGSYPDRAKAEAAVKMLPGKLKPWIRDFAGIKMVMTAPAAPAASTALIASGGIKDSAWVWSQKPTEYTIQLASASDEAAVESVMRGISLPGELAMVASQRNGKPWYALIYGRFASKEAAQGTVARLPASLKKTGPWIRRFSALHDEIGQPPAR